MTSSKLSLKNVVGAALAVVLFSAGGAVAYAELSGNSCCKPDAACCKTHSSCCKHDHEAPPDAR